MQSFAIVEQLDVIKDFCPSLISGLIISMVNDLVLERAKEAFRHRIVVAVALAAHAAQHPILLEQR